jgi:transposase-like zinc-binding protein
VALTIQRILNVAYPAYAATRRLPVRVHKAVSALRRCRTGALGAHAVVCRAGHVVAVRANSCRHRACPQCGWRKAAEWLEQWATRLLPTAHFHVIFTLPPLLHALWRWNRAASPPPSSERPATPSCGSSNKSAIWGPGPGC